MDDSERKQFGSLLSNAATQWTGYAAIGSFVVYVLGYLALRFQLTAVGAGTDLQLVDERYLFEGTKFLVYIVSTVPVVVLLALPVLAVEWLLTRRLAVARGWHTKISRSAGLWVAVLLSLAVIQFVMRQCLLFDNLLLRDELPKPAWFAAMLLAETDFGGQFYFAALLLGIVVTGGFAIGCRPRGDMTARPRILWSVLCVLVAIQILLLPVNYGILMGARPLPRLAVEASEIAVGEQSTVWLVWEGDEGRTFFVINADGQRRLTTLPHDTIKRVDIVAYDPLSKVRSWQSPRAQPLLPNRKPSGAVRDEESSWRKWSDLALLAGIGASPRLQKAPGDTSVRGDVYLMPAQPSAPAERLTTSGRFHSPIFLPGDDSLLALEDDRVVQIDRAGGEPRMLAVIKGITRLVGVRPDVPHQILGLSTDDDGRLQLILFDLSTNQVATVIPSPPSDDQEKAFAWFAEGEMRDYGNVRLFVEESSTEIGKWQDVFIQRGDSRPQNLTLGKSENSRQPALSHDGRSVTFVRSE